MEISGQLADAHMRTCQNRQGDKANGRYFQKLQNNTQNINPRHQSNEGGSGIANGRKQVSDHPDPFRRGRWKLTFPPEATVMQGFYDGRSPE
ncbi:hypothetical protein FY133_08875 [Agrobacterium tumefaciens]|uniref:hypothetical protein n=1 Tax=Agrobacterium tumefaciens TaxID=358 RepID=UPI0021D2609B|nr:hypothetical protein [Agrobacterium tumefaciens]UXS08060.1 hypothetical protein FY155_08915 [Agrobacterium tumefaciens]UXT64037.1 hypothetical protein FY133_08875 [Agrobacterium tumefaciens]